MGNARVLVVDDDEAIVSLVRRGLTLEGYEVLTATDGEAALAILRQQLPDVVILDRMLPRIDGAEICRRLRALEDGANVPVIMLTARGSVGDRVSGLDAGADDYMVKPFALEELLARVRANLRRNTTAKDNVPASIILKYEDLTLDTSTREVSYHGQNIELTTKEFELLEFFMRHPRQVLTREVIYEHVWGYDFGGESNILEVYIRYLRQKLEAVKAPKLMHTVRGAGYVLKD